jgi:hypothetical protein
LEVGWISGLIFGCFTAFSQAVSFYIRPTFGGKTPNFSSSSNAQFRPHAAFLNLLARRNPAGLFASSLGGKNHSPGPPDYIPFQKHFSTWGAIYSIYDTPAIFGLFYSINGRR